MAEAGEGAGATSIGEAELAAVRELALKAHPDAVPELVRGASVAEVMASLEPARAAYRRIAEAATGQVQAPVLLPVPPAVPAGDAPRVVVDVDRLPATEKIRRGLAGRR
jgi:hypothetical protein